MVDISKQLAEGWIRCHAVIELIGKPKEHIEGTMKEYVEKIKNEDSIQVIDVQVAETKQMETGAKQEEMIKEMWATFAELDMLVKDPMTLTYFCFDYMPSSIEIVEPEKLSYGNNDLTEFFNDLQARLHKLDMMAKQMKSELVFLRKGMHTILKNYIKVLLHGQKLTAEQLCGLTGVEKERLEEFLDQLVDEGKVSMEGKTYTLVSADA